MEFKKCTNNECGEFLPANKNYFYSQKTVTKKHGVRYRLNSWCKKCTNKKAAKYRQENIEICRARELNYYHSDPIRKERKKSGYRKHRNEHKEEYALRLAIWQKDNPDRVSKHHQHRAMHQKHEISVLEWEECKKYFNHRCAYCGLGIEDHYINWKGQYILGDFHKDHFDHEGNNGLENCIPACKRCNTSKHNIKFEQWYSHLNDDYAKERFERVKRWISIDSYFFTKSR